ncbi:hypothetical protein EGM70_17950 [Enterobacteriaceae bacterium 89]|nr:hypothetical protein [Enterobacteriaceae bacterium 89]
MTTSLDLPDKSDMSPETGPNALIIDDQFIAACVAKAQHMRSLYPLSELLDNTDYPLDASERIWVDAPAMGRELL